LVFETWDWSPGVGFPAWVPCARCQHDYFLCGWGHWGRGRGRGHVGVVDSCRHVDVFVGFLLALLVESDGMKTFQFYGGLRPPGPPAYGTGDA